MSFFYQKKFQWFILIGLAVVFFGLYSYLALTAPVGFNSPDEMANNFFIRLYVQENSLKFYEPLNKELGNIIHPRSITVSGDYLVPESFLGLILIYGFLGKISLSLIPFLTPLISALTVLFFFVLLRKIFNQEIAFWAAILLFFLPPFWYYSARGFFPDVLALDFLIISFYFLIVWGGKIFKWFLAGFFLGLSLIVKTSSLGWLAVILLILYFLHRRELRWPQVLFFLLALALPFIPILYQQNFLYGRPWITGYALGDGGILPSAFATSTRPLGGILMVLFLPFGFNLKILAANFYHYFVWFFWPWFLPAFWGLVKFRGGHFERCEEFRELSPAASLRESFSSAVTPHHNDSRAPKIYLSIFGLVLLGLVLYYGSWQIFDNFKAGPATIGTSYVRYWLVLYVLALPLVSFFLVNLKKRFSAVFLSLIFLSIFFTFNFGPESLDKVGDNIVQYQRQAVVVQNLTPEKAVILTERTDKFFFPVRRVVNYHEERDKINQNLAQLYSLAPVYYFTKLSGQDIQYLNKEKLSAQGLEFQLIQKIGTDYLLYQLIKKP